MVEQEQAALFPNTSMPDEHIGYRGPTACTAAGITYAVALSSSMVFRLVTFWIRIPLGWFALQHLQKRNLV